MSDYISQTITVSSCQSDISNQCRIKTPCITGMAGGRGGGGERGGGQRGAADDEHGPVTESGNGTAHRSPPVRRTRGHSRSLRHKRTRREGTSEAAPEAVGQAVGGGCQSGWGRLLSVTSAIEPGTCRQVVAGHRLGTLEGGVGGAPPFQCIPGRGDRDRGTASDIVIVIRPMTQTVAGQRLGTVKGEWVPCPLPMHPCTRGKGGGGANSKGKRGIR